MPDLPHPAVSRHTAIRGILGASAALAISSAPTAQATTPATSAARTSVHFDIEADAIRATTAFLTSPDQETCQSPRAHVFARN